MKLMEIMLFVHIQSSLSVSFKRIEHVYMLSPADTRSSRQEPPAYRR